MRRMRRGGASGHEFGGSGEDSFVAVVVTKLTGALLFILLLAMVIMALLPKAADTPGLSSTDVEVVEEPGSSPLEVSTPSELPEAIVGRPYRLALAAIGGRPPLRWGLDGSLPGGLQFDPESGQIHGVPRDGGSVDLMVRVSDGDQRAGRPVRLLVFKSDRPLGLPSKWMPSLPPVPWRSWLDQGFGFLVLLLIHIVGMQGIAGLERWSRARSSPGGAVPTSPGRFRLYRWLLRLATLAALSTLAAWLTWPRG